MSIHETFSPIDTRPNIEVKQAAERLLERIARVEVELRKAHEEMQDLLQVCEECPNEIKNPITFIFPNGNQERIPNLLAYTKFCEQRYKMFQKELIWLITRLNELVSIVEKVSDRPMAQA